MTSIALSETYYSVAVVKTSQLKYAETFGRHYNKTIIRSDEMLAHLVLNQREGNKDTSRRPAEDCRGYLVKP